MSSYTYNINLDTLPEIPSYEQPIVLEPNSIVSMNITADETACPVVSLEADFGDGTSHVAFISLVEGMTDSSPTSPLVPFSHTYRNNGSDMALCNLHCYIRYGNMTEKHIMKQFRILPYESTDKMTEATVLVSEEIGDGNKITLLETKQGEILTIRH